MLYFFNVHSNILMALVAPSNDIVHHSLASQHSRDFRAHKTPHVLHWTVENTTDYLIWCIAFVRFCFSWLFSQSCAKTRGVKQLKHNSIWSLLFLIRVSGIKSIQQKYSITLPRNDSLSSKNTLVFMCVVKYRFCTEPVLDWKCMHPSPVKMKRLFLSFKRDF